MFPIARRATSTTPTWGRQRWKPTPKAGEGAEGDFRPSATFADWPEDDVQGEVAPRRQPKVGPPGASSPAGQGGAERRHAGPSSLGGKPKKFKGAAATTKREEAAAKANRFRKEVKRPPLVSA